MDELLCFENGDLCCRFRSTMGHISASSASTPGTPEACWSTALAREMIFSWVEYFSARSTIADLAETFMQHYQNEIELVEVQSSSELKEATHSGQTVAQNLFYGNNWRVKY